MEKNLINENTLVPIGKAIVMVSVVVSILLWANGYDNRLATAEYRINNTEKDVAIFQQNQSVEIKNLLEKMNRMEILITQIATTLKIDVTKNQTSVSTYPNYSL